MHKPKQKQIKSVIKEKSYRFWHSGIEYICIINSPDNIPDYRLREIFYKSFIGKDIDLSVKLPLFKALSIDIDYTVVPVERT